MSAHNLTNCGDYLIAQLEDQRALIDTGAPSSFGNADAVTVGGVSFPLADTFNGTRVQQISELIGTEIDCLLGMDLLAQFDLAIVENGRLLQLHTSAQEWTGGHRFAVQSLVGVPTIDARIGGTSAKVIIDTGAPIGYLLQESRLADFAYLGDAEDFSILLPEKRFSTPIHDVQVQFSEAPARFGCGRLPERIAMPLRMAGVDAVLGVLPILGQCDLLLSMRQKILSLRPKRHGDE